MQIIHLNNSTQVFPNFFLFCFKMKAFEANLKLLSPNTVSSLPMICLLLEKYYSYFFARCAKSIYCYL